MLIAEKNKNKKSKCTPVNHIPVTCTSADAAPKLEYVTSFPDSSYLDVKKAAEKREHADFLFDAFQGNEARYIVVVKQLEYG